MIGNYLFKFWVFYRIFVRKVYFKRTKGFGTASENAAFLLVVINFITIALLSEAIFNYSGLVRLSLSRNIPLGPISGALFFVVALMISLIYPNKKSKRDRLGHIRDGYNKLNKVPVRVPIVYFVLSVIAFALTLNFVVNSLL
ncbi:MAG TPA: hypothetical protein DDX92_07645 [Flavobacteriales bacterium]|jgi:hypothetical protein|nr:hypothetical protein [Flavobacteriales bacterium]